MRGKKNLNAETYRTDVNLELGYRLRKRRLAQKMSLVEIADKIGVSHQMVARYENGECDIPLSRFFQVCEILGASYRTVLRHFEPPLFLPPPAGSLNVTGDLWVSRNSLTLDNPDLD